MNTYPFVLSGLLVLWVVPLMGIWVRYDRFPHGKLLLAAILLWPTLLIDELLKAFGQGQSMVYLAGMFQFVPALIAALLLHATLLLVTQRRQNLWRYYMPSLVLALGEVPYLLQSAEQKSAMLMSPPVGNLLTNWPYYAPYMLSGFVLLILATKAVEWIAEYHQHLSEQVVDVGFFRLHALNGGFISLIVVAFVDIILTTLATFGLAALPIWQTMIHLFQAFTLLYLITVLVQKRRYSPSPLDYDALENPGYSGEALKNALQKAEQTLIDKRAYKVLGLRLSQLAKAADVEPHLLAAATKTLLNRNFRAFVYHYRLEYAKKVLMRSDAKVSSVAKRLGFNSEKYLSSIFIKYIQMMGEERHTIEEDHFL